ncbi:MAG: hypothetical protein ACEPO8_13400 [Rhodothermaceae bacterium]
MYKILLLCIILFTLCGCQPDVAKQTKLETDVHTNQKLSPSSVLVKAELLDKTDKVIKIRIVNVLEYGADTPSIKRNTVLELRVSKVEEFNKGNIYKLILGSEINEDSGKEKVYWGFIDIWKEKTK